jgi:FkbM family methyltransferase
MEHYEPETVALLDELLAGGGTFLDIGANIGFFTLHVASKHKGVRVVAFEPNPSLFPLLAKNVEVNGFVDVVCKPFAISSKRGTAQLHLSASDMSASLEGDFSHQRSDSVVEVPMESLDAYAQETAIIAPLVIKLDVEGHEKHAFEGAIRTLRVTQPDIITEVAERFETDPYPELREVGYKYYQITDEGLKETDALFPSIRDSFWFSNYLFSTRPQTEIERLSKTLRHRMASVNLNETSCMVSSAKIQRLNRVR